MISLFSLNNIFSPTPNFFPLKQMSTSQLINIHFFPGSAQHRNTLTLQVKVIYRLHYPKLFAIPLSLAEQRCKDNQHLRAEHINKIVNFLILLMKKNPSPLH